MGEPRPTGGWAVWRVLVRSQLRVQPLRLAVTVFAVALGVALGAAVYLVNTAALNDFTLAAKRLVGEADVVIRGPREGFPDGLFAQLARDPEVRLASPVLELEAAIRGHRDPLKVLGLDPFRAAALQPALIGDLEAKAVDLFAPDAVLLSASAAQDFGLKAGGMLPVMIGNETKLLKVVGVLPESTYPQDLGIMDIGSAQWTLQQVGRLNRIDLSLRAGASAAAFRSRLEGRLPAGTVAVAPEVERGRALTVTRAYRINLNMLALVSLLTGAFLVFSTQSLSVLRRRSALGLMRALGATRGQIEAALIGEGALIGLAGSLIGILLGVLCAEAALRFASADLGNGQLHAQSPVLETSPSIFLVFLLTGTAVSGFGAWRPAHAASMQRPAQSLKGGDPRSGGQAVKGSIGGGALLIAGAALAWLPPLGGLPVFGYVSIAALLFGAVMQVPMLTVRTLSLAPRLGHVVPDTSLAQLRDDIGMSTLSLSSIIVSFSLMVAMAIMVYSFRVSFERWLDKVLPADVQLREPLGNDTAYWTAADQTAAGAVAGVSRAEFRRTRQIFLDPARPPVTLIARGATASQTAGELPLLRSLPPARLSGEPAWISEELQDLYGYRPGDPIDLPLDGRQKRFVIAGIWRDYARAAGAVVISRDAYESATGDHDANEGSVWLDTHADTASVVAALRAALTRGSSAAPGALEILTTPALRERSLSIFDRAFAITYALEAIAVIIGLIGVSFAASSTVLARRSEFGMLRHIGMRRRQVLGMLASEGILMSGCAVAYGLVLGAVLSLVLVFVVNRQSFNWSIELAFPMRQLALLSLTLIAAAALTAVWSGRAATHREAVGAVREDW